jgi:hypothetical protein
MIVYVVYFVAVDHFALVVVLEYIKLSLYCFIISMFFAFLLRLIGQDTIVQAYVCVQCNCESVY